TSFSAAGERSRAKLMPVLDNLERYNGDTLSRKTENYLYSIGLSKQQIYNIKAIMLGLDADGFKEEKIYELEKREFFYTSKKGGNVSLSLYEEAEVSSVAINGVEVGFEQAGKKITLYEDGIKTAGTGNLTGTLNFKDGNKVRFGILIDEVNITEDSKITHRINGPSDPYYTYVFLSYPNDIFEGIEYHFHSRPDEFPDVESNILINGVSVKELNKRDMSRYTFSEFPGNSMDRYKVPVTLLCQGNNVTLLIHTGWLADYLNGRQMTVTLKNGFEFTNNGIRYYIDRDKTYVNSNSTFNEKTE
ncbi:MAG: hypothetical protein IKQ18_06535, partial [Clostridia bacterium]|nr:hypothetical protein [Clostridia bacterium]